MNSEAIDFRVASELFANVELRVTIFTQVVRELTLTESDQAIINVLKESDGLSTKEIANAINKSPRATRSRLINLIGKGLVIEVAKGVHDPGRKYFYKK